MQEKTIFKTSILIIFIGLTILIFYINDLNLQQIETLDSVEIEKEVKMKGMVNKLNINDKVIFLELEGQKTEIADVILFTNENLYLKEGDYIEIVGTIEEYQGKKEIIANKIVKR